MRLPSVTTAIALFASASVLIQSPLVHAQGIGDAGNPASLPKEIIATNASAATSEFSNNFVLTGLAPLGADASSKLSWKQAGSSNLPMLRQIKPVSASRTPWAALPWTAGNAPVIGKEFSRQTLENLAPNESPVAAPAASRVLRNIVLDGKSLRVHPAVLDALRKRLSGVVFSKGATDRAIHLESGKIFDATGRHAQADGAPNGSGDASSGSLSDDPNGSNNKGGAGDPGGTPPGGKSDNNGEEFTLYIKGQNALAKVQTSQTVVVELQNPQSEHSQLYTRMEEALKSIKKSKSKEPLVAKVLVDKGDGTYQDLGQASITSARVKLIKNLSLTELRGETEKSHDEAVTAQVQAQHKGEKASQQKKEIHRQLLQDLVGSLNAASAEHSVTEKTPVHVIRFKLLARDKKSEQSLPPANRVSAPVAPVWETPSHTEVVPLFPNKEIRIRGDEAAKIQDEKNPLSISLHFIPNRDVKKKFWKNLAENPRQHIQLVTGEQDSRTVLFTTLVDSVKIKKIGELTALDLVGYFDDKELQQGPAHLRKIVLDKMHNFYPEEAASITEESEIAIAHFLNSKIAKEAVSQDSRGGYVVPELPSVKLNNVAETTWDFENHKPRAVILHLESLGLQGRQVAPEIAQRIRRLQDAGVIVVLITSRPYDYIQSALLNQLKATRKNPLIVAASNGSQIRYYNTKSASPAAVKHAPGLQDLRGIPEEHIQSFRKITDELTAELNLSHGNLENYQSTYLYGGDLPQGADLPSFKKQYEAHLASSGLGELYDVLVESPSEDGTPARFFVVPKLAHSAPRILESLARSFMTVYPNDVDSTDPRIIKDYTRVLLVTTYSREFDWFVQDRLRGERHAPYTLETVPNQVQLLTLKRQRLAFQTEFPAKLGPRDTEDNQVYPKDLPAELKNQADILSVLEEIYGEDFHVENVRASDLRNFYYWASRKGGRRDPVWESDGGLISWYSGTVVNEFINRLLSGLGKGGTRYSMGLSGTLGWFTNMFKDPAKYYVMINPILAAAKEKWLQDEKSPQARDFWSALTRAKQFLERFMMDNIFDTDGNILYTKLDAMRNLAFLRGKTTVEVPDPVTGNILSIHTKPAAIEYIPDHDNGLIARVHFFKTGKQPDLEGFKSDPYLPIYAWAALASNTQYKDAADKLVGGVDEWTARLRQDGKLDGTFWNGNKRISLIQVAGHFMTRDHQWTFLPMDVVNDYRGFLHSLGQGMFADLDFMENQRKRKALEKELQAEMKAKQEQAKKVKEQEKAEAKRKTYYVPKKKKQARTEPAPVPTTPSESSANKNPNKPSGQTSSPEEKSKP